MIFGKLWRSIMAQINKLANFFWTADPIAQMQYEYDLAVDQLKEGREGLEQYRALVERVTRQVADRPAARRQPGSQGQGLPAGRRPRDGGQVRPGAAEGQERAGRERGASSRCTRRPTTTTSPRSSTPRSKLAEIREKIAKYDAELKMSRAEAEMAKLATDFNFDVTTDFGQIEQVIQDKIGLNRAKVRVAADLSGEGLVDIKREQAMEKALADQALQAVRGRDGPGHARDGQGRRSRRRSLGRRSASRPQAAVDRAMHRVTASSQLPLNDALAKPPIDRAPRRSCPTGIRPGHASWPSCISPARPACSSCTATCTTWSAARRRRRRRATAACRSSWRRRSSARGTSCCSYDLGRGLRPLAGERRRRGCKAWCSTCRARSGEPAAWPRDPDKVLLTARAAASSGTCSKRPAESQEHRASCSSTPSTWCRRAIWTRWPAARRPRLVRLLELGAEPATSSGSTSRSA